MHAVGKLFDGIDEKLAGWLDQQKLFFVATAPLSGEGHVNLSPKGLGDFAVLGPREVAWLDLVGSGAETLAHLRENGRITLMFCAFEGPPRIVRLYGRGRALEPGDEGFDALAARFPERRGRRSVIHVSLERIADSCGYGVPLYRYEGERTQMEAWAKSKDADALRGYQLENNLASIDGLPALRAERLRKEREDA